MNACTTDARPPPEPVVERPRTADHMAEHQRHRNERLDALRDLFLTYPHPVSQDRMKQFGNLTKWIPQEVFAQACRNACITTEGGRCPGPGDIYREALKLAPGEHTAGRKQSVPVWYQNALALRTRPTAPTDVDKPKSWQVTPDGDSPANQGGG